MTLSVVIATINQAALVNCCIEEVRRSAVGPVEIVLVDNGSTGKDGELLGRLGERKADVYLHYALPLGYAAAYNAGVAASSGEYVMLLNNDAWPTQRGWDARLVSVLEQVTDAMLVSPTMPRVCWHHQRAHGPQPADCTVLLAPRVAFVAPLLRRSTWNTLGPLDTRFVVGAYEDDDYCERILQANGQIVVDPAVWFFHVSGVTMMAQYEDVLPTNRRLFAEKWGLADDLALMTHDKRWIDAD
jgi:GT2 family glycosyltransferase